jgi:hypothetical protein
LPDHSVTIYVTFLPQFSGTATEQMDVFISSQVSARLFAVDSLLSFLSVSPSMPPFFSLLQQLYLSLFTLHYYIPHQPHLSPSLRLSFCLPYSLSQILIILPPLTTLLNSQDRCAAALPVLHVPWHCVLPSAELQVRGLAHHSHLLYRVKCSSDSRSLRF